jgi:hypothetical protein
MYRFSNAMHLTYFAVSGFDERCSVFVVCFDTQELAE